MHRDGEDDNTKIGPRPELSNIQSLQEVSKAAKEALEVVQNSLFIKSSQISQFLTISLFSEASKKVAQNLFLHSLQRVELVQTAQ